MNRLGPAGHNYVEAQTNLNMKRSEERDMNRSKIWLMSAVAALAFTMVSVTSAEAAQPRVALGDDLHVVAQSTTINQNCLKEVANALGAAETESALHTCSSTVTLSSSNPVSVTVADVAEASQSLTTAQYQTLVAAAAAGKVKSKQYSQAEYQVTDSETQYGVFYYDGSHAWVTHTYRGYQGTHICRVDYATVYAVSNTGCSESGSTSQRDLQVKWQFNLVAKIVPISWEETYTIHVNSSGNIWQ